MYLESPSKEEKRAERIRLRSLLTERCKEIPGPFFRRISGCGLPVGLLCGACSEPRRVTTRCGWKCCPVCQYAATAQTADRFSRIAKNCQWPLLVTFNASHEESDGVTVFREMRRALIRLRAQRWWKQRVKGGVACWEVSRLSSRERKKRRLGKDRGWHFHCHALLDCRWLYQSVLPPRRGASDAERAARIKEINEELATTWSGTLGGRKGSIDVRRVWHDDNGGIDGAVHEVCKYAMTGAALAESEYDIAPVLWALEKTRMVNGFGSFNGHPDVKRRRPAPAMCACGCSAWEFIPHGGLRWSINGGALLDNP